MTDSTDTRNAANRRRRDTPTRREDTAEFSKKLRDRRHEARLSQATVATRLGRPTSFVAKYESGYRRLDVIEFLQVAEAIGFDPVDFLHAVRNHPDADSSPW